MFTPDCQSGDESPHSKKEGAFICTGWALLAAGIMTRATPEGNVTGDFALAPGPHHIRIGGREPLVKWDELLISNSPFSP